jgi:phosphatidylinositol 3-kinase
VQVWAGSKPLTIPVRTSYKSFKAARAYYKLPQSNVNVTYRWKEWLWLPIRYSDLPSSSQIAITIWDSAGPRKQVPFGGTTVSLFTNSDKSSHPRLSLYCRRLIGRTLKTGHIKLKLWLGKEADGLSDTSTPGTFTSTNEMDRLEKLMKRHEQGDLPRLDWLDNIVFRKIEQLNISSKSPSTNTTTTASAAGGEVFLYIDFPRFDFPVIFSDYEYPEQAVAMSLAGMFTTRGVIEEGDGGPANFVTDAETSRDNPVEAKHRRLVRSHRNGPLDRDLKPNAKIRDELNVPPSPSRFSGFLLRGCLC